MTGPCMGGKGRCSNPTYVKTRDRVTAPEVQKVLWKRGEGAAVAYTVEEFELLFDCRKRTCVGIPESAGGGPFLAGDLLAFIFEDVVQLESAQITRKEEETLQVGAVEIIRDVPGGWKAYHPDGTFTDGSGPKLQVHKKTSAGKSVV